MKFHPGKSLGSQLASIHRNCSSMVCHIPLYVSLIVMALLTACDNSTSSPTTTSGASGSVIQNTSSECSSGTGSLHVLSIDPKIGQFDVAMDTEIVVKFSEALDPLTVSPASLILMSGSLADDTLPRQPVTGTVSYDDTNFMAVFKPNANLAPNTTYTLLASRAISDANGNCGQFFKSTFTTIANPINDTIAPTVSATLPVNGAINISANRSIIATFSEAMAPGTINAGSFTVQNDSTKVNISGVVTYSGNNAQFKPDAPLADNTRYNVVISATVTDLSGNPLGVDYYWSFTTAVAGGNDNTPPGVSVVTPRNNAVDIAINSAISASFNEPLNPLSVSGSSFMLTDGSSMVSGVVNYNGTTATFTPDNSLATTTTYTATLTTAITDLAGNNMAADYSWSFTTAADTGDTTPPTVTSESPVNGAIDVARNSAISVDFSEALNPATVNTASFILTSASGVVAGNVTYNGISASFTPLVALQDSTLYTATLTANIADLAGNTLTSNYAWSFTTAAATAPSDITPPTVVDGSQVPADTATNVATNEAVSVAFDEVLDPGSVNTSTFLLTGPGSVPVAGSVRYNGTTATFTPLVDLQNSSSYTATVTTGIKDLAGNAMTLPVSWTFTTAAVQDITPPILIARSPVSGAINVPVTTSISAQFNEALDPSSVTSASVSVTLTTGGFVFPVAGSVLYSNNTITFVPSANLAFRSTYTITIRSSVTDLAGNALTANISWSFTTGNPGPGGGGMGGGGGGG